MSIAREALDYSIVICTYNPDERLLKRCLQAVLQLQLDGITTEVILVDNNSDTPVKDLPYVQSYLRQIPGMQAIFVAEQGVSHARIAAINIARGKFIVYFDYDNEPASDYLQQLQQLNTAYPMVASWGPGNITVDFIDGIAKNIEPYALPAFQERHETSIAYACMREWQSCYPFGTGMCTYTFLLKEYIVMANEGKLTLSGRKGALLTSGEDTQMVLLCIRKGYAAGVAPALNIKHMIPGSRANFAYLKRLMFGTGICYDTCLLQVFPERKANLEKQLIPAARFSRQAFKKMLKARFSSNPAKTLKLVNYLSTGASVYMALDKPLPRRVNSILKKLQLM